MNRIYKIYWNKLVKINPNISNIDVDSFSETHESHSNDLTDSVCQTAILFLFIRNPHLSKKVIDRICVMQNLCTKMSLAHMLTNLESANVRNIDIAINLLLSESLELQGSVGQGGKNNPDDILRIGDRLTQLSFLDENGFSLQGGIHDWSPLLNFVNIIESGSENPITVIEPGSLSHVWLCSADAPRLVEFNSTSIDNPPVNVINWFIEVFKFVDKKLRVDSIRTFQDGNPFKRKRIEIHSITTHGMQFMIRLPSTNLLECVSSNDPNFDIDLMSVICKTLLKSKFVPSVMNLGIESIDLCNQGLTSNFGSSTALLVKLDVPAHLSMKSNDVEDEFDLSRNTDPESSVDLFDFYSSIIQSSNPGVNIDFDGNGVLHLLGISGWLNEAFAINEKDEYNDTIIALWKDQTGEKIVKSYIGSTSPGKFAKFYNTKGDANLVPGRYAYKRGKHNGYDALVQADEFTVWRDKNKSGIRTDSSLVETGWFGINLHAGGTGSNVKNWSAGCQIIWGGRDAGSPFDLFMQDVESLVVPDELVYYTLVDSLSIPSLEDYRLSVGGDE